MDHERYDRGARPHDGQRWRAGQLLNGLDALSKLLQVLPKSAAQAAVAESGSQYKLPCTICRRCGYQGANSRSSSEVRS